MNLKENIQANKLSVQLKLMNDALNALSIEAVEGQDMRVETCDGDDRKKCEDDLKESIEKYHLKSKTLPNFPSFKKLNAEQKAITSS